MVAFTQGLLCLSLLFCLHCLFVQAQTCIPGGIRLDCCPGGCDQSKCESNGCCWHPASSSKNQENNQLGGIPWCYHSNPPVTGYKLTSIQSTPNGFVGTLHLENGTSVYGPDLTELQLSVFMETSSRLHVKIFDPNSKRWEVPNIIQSSTPDAKPQTIDYEFSYVSNPFGFAITRKSNREVIFNTSSSSNHPFNGLIFKDQYIEISSLLQTSSEPNIYGLGEQVNSLRLPLDSFYTLWAVDQGTPPKTNLYGVHPFYLNFNSETLSASGVFLLNSNGMDIYLSNHTITYKTIGGILDFYFFIGPTPSDVISQYLEVVGKPYMPPFWSLGFHNCRWGYNTVDEVIEVVENYSKAAIPLDTIWTDIDYMENYYDFTFDPIRYPVPKMKQFVNKLHNNHQQYVLITDCGVPNITNGTYAPWDDAITMDVFIKNKNGKPFMGVVWPGSTAWPDFLHPNSTEYWLKQIEPFHGLVPIDGLWTDMNEPSDFCSGSCDEVEMVGTTQSGFDPINPPYAINNMGTRASLNQKTISMDAVLYPSIEYNAHSLYGITEANASRIAFEKIRGKRAFVLSRSTFSGHGHWASHWLGDNESTWADLYYSLPGVLAFQLFGVPMVGADICGFGGNTTVELCSRWIELGAFYTFSRDHNIIEAIPQELYRWPEVADAGRKVLLIRYTLLPYYYTLFYISHKVGATVLNPLFFEFPYDIETLSIDKQFLIGSGILISPVFTEGARQVTLYLPHTKKEVWYDFRTGAKIQGGGWITVPAPLDYIPIHVRGGVVIPMQQPALTSYETKNSGYELVVPFNNENYAVGELFNDDGDSLNTIEKGNYIALNFTAEQTQSGVGYLKVVVVNAGWVYGEHTMTLVQVSVWGSVFTPTWVSVNGAHWGDWKYDQGILTITNLNMLFVRNGVINWGA